MTVEQFQGDRSVTTVTHGRKEFSTIGLASIDWKKKPADRFRVRSGATVATPRNEPVVIGDSAYDALYPQDYALGLIKRATDVKTTDNADFLGRSAVVIEGAPPEPLVTSYGDHFKMWVDTKTGILMKADFISVVR